MAKQKFKHFKKKEQVKKKSSINRGIAKAARLGKRKSNRADHSEDKQSRAPLETLLSEVKTGGVSVNTSSVDLDPRALTNLLLQPSATSAGPAAVTGKSTPKENPEFVLKENTEELPKGTILESSIVSEQKEAAIAKPGDRMQYVKEGEEYAFWNDVKVHQRIKFALKDLGFTHPTPIQKETLPTALSNPLTHDIVCSSETGSGKTLIFALPILQSILRGSNSMTDPAGIYEFKGKKNSKRGRDWLENTDESGEQKKGKKDKNKKSSVLHTLVLTPTRELAQQIALTMEQLGKYTDKNVLRVGCIVGGMAQHKQQRVLNRHPHVLICTPGRIWDLVAKNEGCFLGHSISKRLSFLVLDEADRLLDSGRFEQLKLILERIHSDMLPTGRAVTDIGMRPEGADSDEEETGGPVQWDEELKEFVPIKSAAREEAGSDAENAVTEKDRPRPMAVPPPPHQKHRVITFVTSATLSLEVNYQKRDVKGNRTIIRTKNANTMGSVLNALSIKPSHAKTFEIKPEHGVTSQLHETYLRCPEKAKDLYLYYFLRTYKERTIIFVNAISMLRRLTKFIEILGIPCCGLHAAMQQRQRLTYIDKFKSGERRVLVATDVASRGLDVEGIKYVVHFQLPRSTDGYIHRCGRTARAGGTGFSLAMVDAKEYAAFQKLLDSMGRTDPMEVFAIDPISVHHLHPHLKIATQIDKLQREISKDNAKQRWVKTNADELDLEADELLKEDLEDDNRAKSKALKILQKQLDTLTKRDLDIGHKGSFRSAPKAIGATDAGKKLKDRADRQVYRR